MCENCYNVYLHIQKYYEVDFRSGNLIEKKEMGKGDIQAMRGRAQS